MDSRRRVVLIGAELMMRSRLAAALGEPGLLTVAASAPPTPADAVFVNLNADADARIGAIQRWRSVLPDVLIVGFCGHGEREVRRQAMAAGADRVVTNGGLVAEALRHSS